MTPYIIICKRKAVQENGCIHTMVSNHALKTSLDACKRWINLMSEVHNFTDLQQIYESKDGRLVSYRAQLSTEGEREWVEFDVWKEEDINL